MANTSGAGATSSVGSVNPSASDPTTAGSIAETNLQAELNSDTHFKSMNDLKKKAPKLYNMMMQGIAWNIISEMQHHQARLKQLWRDATQA